MKNLSLGNAWDRDDRGGFLNGESWGNVQKG